jgi:hypothetical protein
MQWSHYGHKEACSIPKLITILMTVESITNQARIDVMLARDTYETFAVPHCDADRINVGKASGKDVQDGHTQKSGLSQSTYAFTNIFKAFSTN